MKNAAVPMGSLCLLMFLFAFPVAHPQTEFLYFLYVIPLRNICFFAFHVCFYGTLFLHLMSPNYFSPFVLPVPSYIPGDLPVSIEQTTRVKWFPSIDWSLRPVHGGACANKVCRGLYLGESRKEMTNSINSNSI